MKKRQKVDMHHKDVEHDDEKGFRNMMAEVGVTLTKEEVGTVFKAMGRNKRLLKLMILMYVIDFIGRRGVLPDIDPVGLTVALKGTILMLYMWSYSLFAEGMKKMPENVKIRFPLTSLERIMLVIATAEITIYSLLIIKG